jgi:hypothetical protein
VPAGSTQLRLACAVPAVKKPGRNSTTVTKGRLTGRDQRHPAADAVSRQPGMPAGRNQKAQGFWVQVPLSV